MTVQLIQECNARVEQIGQAVGRDVVNPDPLKKARARRKLLVMIGMQRTMVREIVDLYRAGITFEAWKELFLRVNSEENIRKIDNAQGEVALITKIVLEQGDLEAYYNQIVLRVTKEQIQEMVDGLPALALFEQQIKNALEGK